MRKFASSIVHVILNEVKDLVPAMQVVFECKDEILRLRLRMTGFGKCLFLSSFCSSRLGDASRAVSQNGLAS